MNNNFMYSYPYKIKKNHIYFIINIVRSHNEKFDYKEVLERTGVETKDLIKVKEEKWYKKL